MNALDLKKLLISKIDDTNDEELLKAVYKLLDYNSSEGKIYKLNDDQVSAVREAQAQIAKGKFITDEELDQEIDKWLSE